MQGRGTIKTFTDLTVWQKGREFVLMIYKVTKDFPEDEKYGLISQMRRAAVSVTSNIAEGFGRRSYGEKVQFYNHASGSLVELKNQILIVKDLDYLERQRVMLLMQRADDVHKLLNALITKSRSYLTSKF